MPSAHPVADPAIGMGGGQIASTRPPAKNVTSPLNGYFKLYMNHCHLDPVNIMFYKHAQFIV